MNQEHRIIVYRARGGTRYVVCRSLAGSLISIDTIAYTHACQQYQAMQFLTLCAVVSLTLPATLIAQIPAPIIESNSDILVAGASLDPAVCRLENSIPLTFDQVMQLDKEIGDQCVAVDGFWSGRALFRSASDANSEFSNVSEALSDRRLGIYGSERLLASAPKHAKRYTLVGQLRRCETAWPGAIMVLGYCHYTGGPFLIASEAHSRS